jgi:hypothetical protein
VIFSRSEPAAEALPQAASGARGDFVLVVPGGGTGHPGAKDAAGEFLAAAHALAATGIVVRYVGPGATQRTDTASPNFQALGTLPQTELADQMRHARLLVVNGGSTLLQGIACGAACIAVPIARDQRRRIRRCVAAGAAVEAALAAPEIAARAQALLRDESSRAALARRAAGLGLADGLEVALSALAPYIESV